METMIIKVVLCVVVPLVFLCGIVDRKNRQILFAVSLGSISCLIACYFNSWLYSILDCSYYYLTTTVAPFVEEIFKFLPILLFAKLDNRSKKYLLSISFAVGMGFAITENYFMLSQYIEDSTIIWILIRGIGTGLMHGMSTILVGLGIYLAFKDERMSLTGTLATLFFAMMYHGTFNAIIQINEVKYIGILIPLVSYGIIMAIMNKNKIYNYLYNFDKESE